MKLLFLSFLFAGFFLYAQDGLKYEEEVDGRTVFLKYKCDACHSHTGQQCFSKNPKPRGLDTLKITDVQSLNNYILKIETPEGFKQHPVKFKGDSLELNTLSNWLINCQDTCK